MSPPELEIVIKIQGDLKAPDSVNEHADKGGRIAILEPSGSGKSIIMILSAVYFRCFSIGTYDMIILPEPADLMRHGLREDSHDPGQPEAVHPGHS